MPYRFYFLFATFLTLPFALRKVIWAPHSPFFKEYSDISLYFFEVFLIGYLGLYILEHKYYIKSIFNKLFHVEQFFFLILISLSTLLAAAFGERYFSLVLLLKWILYILFGIFLYKDLIHIVPRGTFPSSFSHCSTWNISNFKNWSKLFHVEHSPLLSQIVPRGTYDTPLHCSTWNILKISLLLSLFFQSLIIIGQVVLQKSLGIFSLGEPILDPAIAGVATIILNDTELLRGYGTFLHPNIAAFFFFTYGMVFILSIIVPRGTHSPLKEVSNCSTWNTFLSISKSKLFHVEHSFSYKVANIVPRGTIFLIYFVISLGFILTFSKSVLLVSIFIFIIHQYFQYCSTWNNSSRKNPVKLFHVEQCEKERRNVPRGTMWLLILGIVMLLGSVLFFKEGDLFAQSILERKEQYLSIPNRSFLEVLIGSGIGSYVELLTTKSPRLFSWQLQPIHNTYILWIFELGVLPIVGIMLYLWKNWQKYRQYPHVFLAQKGMLAVSGGVALLLAIDHYTWDLEQGQILLVILVAFLAFSFSLTLKNTKQER